VGQGNITFNREVLSCLINPNLIGSKDISPCASKRAKKYKELIVTPTGAYTGNSKGYGYVREKIAEFIQNRDGVPHSDPNNIYLLNGASEGARQAFNMLIRSQ
jgi:aspartate/methionine/tyrosine aminotransferase